MRTKWVTLNNYYNFKTPVTYNNTWYLTSIISIYGGEILLNYTLPNYKTGLSKYHVISWNPNRIDNISTWVYDDTTEEYTQLIQYTLEMTEEQPYTLESIVGDTHTVKFTDALLPIPEFFMPLPKRSEVPWLSEGAYQRQVYQGSEYNLPINLSLPLLNEVKIYEHIVSNDYLIKKFIFEHELFSSLIIPLGGQVQGTFPFLLSVRESNGTYVSPARRFKYNNLNLESNTTPLPWGSSSTKDPFGYHNFDMSSQSFLKQYVYPELSASDRYRWAPLPNYDGMVYELEGYDAVFDQRGISSGMLSEVTLPSEGKIFITYEPNTYYDELTHKDEYGGGVRVKELKVHDGVSTSNDMITTYTYKTSIGNSSGKLVHKPVHAYTLGSSINLQDTTLTYFNTLTSSGADLWKKITLRIKHGQITDPMNYQGSFVLYDRVITAQTGKGYVVNQYDIPQVYGTTTLGNWSATPTKIARENSPATLTYYDFGMIGTEYSYPFAPQTNHSYKSGLLASSATYNEAGQLINEVSNTYTYLPDYQTLKAIKKDKIGTMYNILSPFDSQYYDVENEMYVYSPYILHAMERPLLLSSIKKEYDPADFIEEQITTDINTYQTTGTPYLKNTTRTDAGGTSYGRYYQYNQEYTVPANSNDPFVQTLERMNTEGTSGIVIETRSTIEHPGVTEEVISAEIQKYGYVNNVLINDESYVLRTNAPLDNFVPSVVNNTSLEFDIDTRYEKYQEVIASDGYGNITTVRNNKRQETTTLYAHDGKLPVLSLTGASSNEIAFNNFENTAQLSIFFTFFDEHNFTYGATPYTDGRVKGKALSFRSGTANKLSKAIVRNTIHPTYIVSFWAKTSATASVSVLFNGEVNQTVEDIIVAISADWKYYEKEIDLSSLNTAITVEISTSVDISIDDLILVPKEAIFSYPTYGLGLIKYAETDHLGRSTYYEYDEADRLRLIRDHNKNIISRTTHNFNNDEAEIRKPVISYEGELIVNTPIQFKALSVRDINNSSFYWVVDLAVNEPDETSEIMYSNVTPIIGNNETDLTFPDQQDYVVMLKIVSGSQVYYSKVLIAEDKLKFGSLNVEVCFQGPLKYDLCGLETGYIYTNSCGLSTPAGTAIFQAQASGGSGTIIYEWYKYLSTYSSSPHQLLTTGDTYTFNGESAGTFYLYCKVKYADPENPSFANSKIFTITFYRSDSNCPQ